MRMWFRRACVVFVVVLAGCTTAGIDKGPVETKSVAPSISVPPVFPATYPWPSSTLFFSTEGTLNIDPGTGCITVTDDTGHRSLPLAFPEGTTVGLSDPTKPVLFMEGCRPLVDGDSVYFSGSGMVWEQMRKSDEYYHLFDTPRCGSDLGLLFVETCQDPSRS